MSLGLVRHHFGSKDELRAACDEYALALAMRIKQEAATARRVLMPGPGFLPGVHPTLLLLMQYFTRSISDGSPAADAMFEQFVVFTERWLAQQFPDRFDDPQAVAVLDHRDADRADAAARAGQCGLGVDLLEHGRHIRSTKAFIDIYAQPG